MFHAYGFQIPFNSNYPGLSSGATISRLSKNDPEGYSATFTLTFPKGKLLYIIHF